METLGYIYEIIRQALDGKMSADDALLMIRDTLSENPGCKKPSRSHELS